MWSKLYHDNIIRTFNNIKDNIIYGADSLMNSCRNRNTHSEVGHNNSFASNIVNNSYVFNNVFLVNIIKVVK